MNPIYFLDTAWFFAIIFLSVIFYAMKISRRNNPVVQFGKSLPGPPTLPIIGNYLELLNVKDGRKKMREYSEKYGEIYRLWLGSKLIVGITNPEDMKVLFTHAALREKADTGDYLKEFWGNGLFTAPANVWKKTRKCYRLLFANHIINQYAKIFNEEFRKLGNEWNKLASELEIDVQDYVPHVAFDIVMKSIFNIELDKDKIASFNYFRIIHRIFQNTVDKIIKPWYSIKLIQDIVFKKETNELKKELSNFCLEILKAKKITQDESHSKNEEIQLNSFLNIANQLQEESGNQKYLHDEILTIIGAGVDTVTVTISSCFLALAIHQDVQTKLYAEIYNHFGDDNDRYVDHEDIKCLPYLDKFVKEVLRWFEIIPAVSRDVTEDVKIGNRVFPAGVSVFVPISSIHFDPELYPDPLKFNPENFSSEAIKKRHNFSFLPFSSGGRNCIGHHFAMLEIKIAIITILRMFRLRTKTKEEDIKPNLKVEIIQSTSIGYRISLERRRKY